MNTCSGGHDNFSTYYLFCFNQLRFSLIQHDENLLRTDICTPCMSSTVTKIIFSFLLLRGPHSWLGASTYMSLHPYAGVTLNNTGIAPLHSYAGVTENNTGIEPLHPYAGGTENNRDTAPLHPYAGMTIEIIQA